MTPQYLRLRRKEPTLFADSDTEFNFINKLETPQSHNLIEWWHKNGGQGSEHFSICYVNKQGQNALFYVDFIIRFKNGTIGLFDTKTEGSDELDFDWVKEELLREYHERKIKNLDIEDKHLEKMIEKALLKIK